MKLALACICGVVICFLVLGVSVIFAEDNCGFHISRDRNSYSPELNSDGSLITFFSDSDFLGQDIRMQQFEVWLYDTEEMNYQRVTTDNLNVSPKMSADGRKIVFWNKTSIIFSQMSEIILYDTMEMTSTWIATMTSPMNPDNYVNISQDGTKIVFVSDADILGQGIPKNQYEIWLYDIPNKTYTRITTASSIDRDSKHPVLNGDNSKIVFDSDSDFLGQGIEDNQYEIWLYDIPSMTFTRITTLSHPGRWNGRPDISQDGTKIVFASDSDFLGQGIPEGQTEIWLYDTSAITLTRITTASTNLRRSGEPDLSADGTTIVFSSDSDILGQGIVEYQDEIWLYDLLKKEFARVTTNPTNEKISSSDPKISDNKNKIVFGSMTDFLDEGIMFGQYNIWLYDVPTQKLSRITTSLEKACFIYIPVIFKQ